jgi:hypothetical protein
LTVPSLGIGPKSEKIVNPSEAYDNQFLIKSISELNSETMEINNLVINKEMIYFY